MIKQFSLESLHYTLVVVAGSALEPAIFARDHEMCVLTIVRLNLYDNRTIWSCAIYSLNIELPRFNGFDVGRLNVERE
jgi:hypothetical protein